MIIIITQCTRVHMYVLAGCVCPSVQASICATVDFTAITNALLVAKFHLHNVIFESLHCKLTHHYHVKNIFNVQLLKGLEPKMSEKGLYTKRNEKKRWRL